MKVRFLGLAVGLIGAMDGPAGAVAIVLYENDFTTRTSWGAIERLTTFDYARGELVPATHNGVGQDEWIRRHTGTKRITVVDPDTVGNQYVAFSTLASNPQHYGYAYQKIGSSVGEGVLQFSVDILAPNHWTANLSAQSNVALGGDSFYDFGTGYEADMASRFGFAPIGSGTAVQFAAYDGTSEQTATGVTGGNWYRFVADLDLATDTYSLNVYDLGATQPEPEDVPASGPVAAFSDLAFYGNSVDAITAVRLVSICNGTVAGKHRVTLMEAGVEGTELDPYADPSLAPQEVAARLAQIRFKLPSAARDGSLTFEVPPRGTSEANFSW